LSKYQISRNAKNTNTKKGLLASCGLLILPLFYSGIALAQNLDDQIASIPADNVAQITPRITLNEYDKSKLRSAVNSSVRVEVNRDKYRHPEQTIEFFGIKPDATVIEIWPGQGWYTSILGPYLKSGGGHLVAANFDTSTTNSDLVQKVVDSFKDKFSAQPEIYGDVKVVPFGPRSGAMVADGTADAVLTFRNIHNWMAQGWSDKAFNDFYRALKPGGILGIEEHRADDDTPQDPMAADGYVRQDYVISLAKDAGFELVDISEINANVKDTKDHPYGVWTLPPVLRTAPMGQSANPRFDSSRYNTIGESDRMTLLFRKPLKTDKPAALAVKSGPIPIPVLFSDKKSKKDKNTAKTATKVTTAKDAVKTSVTTVATKVEETKALVPTTIKTPEWDKADAKVTAVKEEAKTAITKEAAKIDDAKNSASIASKTPSWDKAETKVDTLKADNTTKAQTEVAKANETKTTITESVKPVTDTTKEVKADSVIPELPSNIITSDTPTEIKPQETPAISEAKPSIATMPEMKKTESTPKVTHTKAKNPVTKADAVKEKPATKSASKKPAKANEKTTKKVEPKTATKAETKPTSKTAVNKSKTSTKPTAKTATKSTTKTTAKTDAKKEVKPTSKTASKTTTSKTGTKPKTEAKPTSKSKNPNVPDWAPPKKRK
jgi:predicted methyltransferase